MTKHLLITSSTPYSGKTAIILGIANQLQEKGYKLGYVKPIGTDFKVKENVKEEQDLEFIRTTLNLSDKQIKSPLFYLDESTINEYLQGENKVNYQESLTKDCQEIEADLILLEGAGDLKQGSLFNLSMPEISSLIDASVLLIVKYDPLLFIDEIVNAKNVLGDRLKGVLINNIPPEKLDSIKHLISSFLKQIKVDVFGFLPSNRLLQSVSVRELVTQLDAKVLCRENRLDLMVESLTVGAMNVNSALEYFRQRQNMAVITGGDRTDLQLAALESSTNCLILTGKSQPQKLILNRAEDLEIPILSVDLDTLTTVEIVDQTLGKVRIHESIKVDCMNELIKENFDLDQLLSKIG